MCSNVDPRLTLTYLASRSNRHPNAFRWKKLDFFLFSQLICLAELLTLNKLQKSRLSFDLSAKVAHIGVQ